MNPDPHFGICYRIIIHALQIGSLLLTLRLEKKTKENKTLIQILKTAGSWNTKAPEIRMQPLMQKAYLIFMALSAQS